MYKSKMFILLVIITLAFFGWWVVLQILPTKDTIYNYFFNVGVAAIYLIGGLLAQYYAIKTPKEKALHNVFYFFGLTLISWGIAGFIWSFYNLILHIDSPYPSIADFFYLACTFFASIGLWFVFDHFNFSPKRNDIYLSLLIVIFVYWLVFFILLRPDYSDQLPFITIVFNYLYPLTDAFLLSIGVIILITVGKLGFGLGSLTSFLFLQSIGDIIFSWRQTKGNYWNGDISDLLYLLSGVFLVLAMIKMNNKYKNNLSPDSN
jgi:hypothetical protein